MFDYNKTYKKKIQKKKRSLKRSIVSLQKDINQPHKIIGGAPLVFTATDENIPCMLKFNYSRESTKSEEAINVHRATLSTITPQLIDWMITDSNHDHLLEINSVTGDETSYKKNKKYLKAGDVNEFIKFGFGTLTPAEFSKSLISKCIFNKIPGADPPPIACGDNDIVQIIIGLGDKKVSKGFGLYDVYKNDWHSISVITHKGTKTAYIKAFGHTDSFANPEFWLELTKKMSNNDKTGWTDLPKTDKARDIFLTIDASGFVGLSGLALPNKINKESGEYKFGTSGLLEHNENLRINTVYSSTTCADQATSITVGGFNFDAKKKKGLLIDNLNTVYNNKDKKDITDSDIPTTYTYSEHIKSYLLIDSSDFETSNTKHKEAITYNKTLCSFKNTDYNLGSRSINFDAADISIMLSRDAKHLPLLKKKGVGDRFLIDNVNNCVTDTGNGTSAGDLQHILSKYDSSYFIERTLLTQMKRLGDYTQIAYAIDLPKRLLSLYKSNSDDIFGKYTNVGNLKTILDGNSGTTLSDKKTDIDFSKSDTDVTEQFRRRHIHVTGDNPAFAYSIYNGVNSMLTLQTYYPDSPPPPHDKYSTKKNYGCVVCIFDNPI